MMLIHFQHKGMTPMITEYKNEIDRYVRLSDKNKALWLSALMYYVSMDARQLYRIEPDGFIDTEALIEFNEFLHRIASFQMSVIEKEEEYKIPDKDYFDAIFETLKFLNINVKQLIRNISKLVPSEH